MNLFLALMAIQGHYVYYVTVNHKKSFSVYKSTLLFVGIKVCASLCLLHQSLSTLQRTVRGFTERLVTTLGWKT